jgi:BolA protein
MTIGREDDSGRAARMHALLTAALSPAELEIQDDSARHAGHAGATAGGETHYTVRVVSDVFAGRSRLERSRMVNEILAPEFVTGLHALSMILRSTVE